MEAMKHKAYDIAFNQIKAGDHRDAKQVLLSLIASDPNHGDAIHLLGICLLVLGPVEQAVSCFVKAISLRPDDARFHYHHGVSLIEYGQLDAAIHAFRSALDVDPDFHDARFNLAKALKEKGAYQEATAVYEELVDSQPRRTETLYNLANLYFEQRMDDRAAKLYDNVLTMDHRHCNARINLALVHSRNGRNRAAIRLLEQVLTIDPTHEEARNHLQKIHSRLIPAWHFDMLNDDERNRAYDRAISHVAKHAGHVLEIGTGTGLLAMMAARAGAKRVTTCEMIEPLARCAEKIIRANGYEDRIHVLAKPSTALRVGTDMPGKADLLIAEVFDVGLIGEHFLPCLIHAKENLLTKNARILPVGAKIRGRLVECPYLKRIHPIRTIAGFDLSAFNMFRSPGYGQVDMGLGQCRFLSESFDVLDFDFQGDIPLSRKKLIHVTSTAKGVMQAVVFWFEIYLDPDTHLSSMPIDTGNHWKQAIYFFSTDRPVIPNESIELEVVQQRADLAFSVTSHNKP